MIAERVADNVGDIMTTISCVGDIMTTISCVGDIMTTISSQLKSSNGICRY